MSLPRKLSRMAHRFFSQLVAEETEDEAEEPEVDFVPRTEDLTVEYDTCVDISSVLSEVPEDGESASEDNKQSNDNDNDNGGDDACSVPDCIDHELPQAQVTEDITSTIVRDAACDTALVVDMTKPALGGSESVTVHVDDTDDSTSHTHTVTVTRKALRADMSDSEMSGISDAEPEVEVEVEAVASTEVPLTDVINGIVKQRRKEARREARKRMGKKSSGFKISKPHKKHQHNAKELEAIEQQLRND